MRKKEKRLIALKDPRLRKIRTELRNLLRQAFEDHSSRLHKQIERIRADSSLKYEDRKGKILQIYQEKQELKRAFLHSVAGCGLCGKTELDLIYNPILNKWFCEGCYEFNREGHEELYP